MRIVLLVIVAVVLMGINFTIILENSGNSEVKKDSIRSRLEWIEDRKNLLLWVISSIFLLILGGCLIFAYPDQTFLFQCKRVVLMTLLFPAAIIDWKQKVIPNRLILAGIGYRIVILIAEIIWERENLFSYIILEVIAAVGIFFLCVIFLLIMKDSIGMGDIKLFMVMGLYLGLYSMSNAIMSALLLIFVYAVFLLITRKKGKKDVLPFAPAVLIGTYLSIFLTGM